MAITKIDISMYEDVSGANNLVKLDANAKIPAGAATNLTNLPGPVKSSSDPTISSNKTLGTQWLNTTSGEMYVCTDATAGANVWTNVGAGSGNIPIPYVFQGSNYGYSLGGTPNLNIIQRFAFASNTTGTDVGDIGWIEHFSAAGMPNHPSYGYTMAGGGYPSGNSGNPWTYSTNILKFSFASGTQDTVDTNSDIPSAGHYLNVCGASNGINGYGHGGYGIAGGDTPANRIICREIYKFNFATEANATNVGDLPAKKASVGSHQY